MSKFAMFTCEKKFQFYFVLYFSIFLAGGLAEELPSETDTNSVSTSFYQDPTKGTESRGDPYVFLLGRTILVLLAFLVLAYLIRRYLRSRQKHIFKEGGPIQVLYDFPLSINKSLKVVQVVNDYLLLGVTQEHVQLIEKIEDKESIDVFAMEKSKAAPRVAFFRDLFAKHIKIPGESPIEATKRLRSKLNALKH